MASEPVTCWRVDYLTCYWSDMHNAGLPVAESAWQPTGHECRDQAEALQYAARQAAATKQVYAIVKITYERVVVLDGLHMAKPGFSDRA